MRRSHVQTKDPAAPVTAALPEVAPWLRDSADEDLVVEEMVQRLRGALSGMVALDEYGRPVPWRSVVRVALGPRLAWIHDAETSLASLQQVLLPKVAPSVTVPEQGTGADDQPAETTWTTRERTVELS